MLIVLIVLIVIVFMIMITFDLVIIRLTTVFLAMASVDARVPTEEQPIDGVDRLYPMWWYVQEG